MKRLAWIWLVAVAAAALGADCLASDRAIVARQRGALDWRPAARGDELRATLTADDWAIWPPIAADPIEVRTAGRLEPLAPPSHRHRLGTDDRGRDVAARWIHGARTTALVALVAALIALALGVGAALAAAAAATRGRAGRAFRTGLLAIADAVASAPAILVGLAAGALVGVRGAGAIALLIAVPRGADTARLALAQLEAALAEPYVEAARAVGASRARTLLRHALPAAGPTLAAATAITAATAVLAEAALSFLGLGAPPPTPSWGELLAQATQHDLRWWLSIPAGLATTLTAAALFALALQPGNRPRFEVSDARGSTTQAR